MTNSSLWLKNILIDAFTPKKKKTITEWLESPGLILPNNTA